ncbi:MAG: hypothetical protein JW726_09410 [Anaerolineales bacterium]|nr:hypothetical protein [Anaerolineales bacterium]
MLASNIQEVDPQVVLRPLLICLLGGGLLFIASWLILRNWLKAGITSSFLLTLFFSYGHIYAVLETVSLAGIQVGRHRYLAVIYGAILLVGLWWILRRFRDFAPATQALNAIAVILVFLPILQIASFLWQSTTQEKQNAAILASSEISLPSHPEPLPDIYYIILDMHTRGDALQDDFNYDNSAFLDALRQEGFYVADCSRSNYAYTQASIASALNIDYVQHLRQQSAWTNPDENVWILIQQSRVRSLLESLGYKTVAFDTGYEWSRLTDADIYLSLGSDSLSMQMVNPFEAMLIKSTAGLILTDSQNQFMRGNFQEVNFPHSFHVNNQRFILTQLPEIARNPEPTFVFAHILIPHYPFVFQANGDIVSDPGYYSGDKSGPINDEYMIDGYVNQVQFIDQAMLDILREILANSPTPPILIVQGDHGVEGDNRYEILNAYYLPGMADAGQEGFEAMPIYPDITPVNSFRLVFDAYFGASFGLLEDLSFSNQGEIIPETSPACTQNP